MEGVTHDDQFPKGLRVLVVDDNVPCLHVLEKMLQECSYRVTKCQRGEEALSKIRENEDGFDILLTDVHMPGMDGLQLLAEITNMGVTLPVVVFSSDAGKDTVLKGVNSGACDFLVKPIQINTLKILWQHVLRSKRSSSNNSTKELDTLHTLTTSLSDNTRTQAEYSKSLKGSSEDEADHGESKSGAKKPRVVWTPELNRMFIMAVNSLGDDNAKPKKILQIMRKMKGIPYLTRQNVSSHLQKYRANSKKIGEALEHRNAQSSLINGHGFANLTHATPSPLSLFGCECASSTQYPSHAMSIAPQFTGCSMRIPNPVEFPNNNALSMYQMGLQSQPLGLLQQPNPPLENYGLQQQENESAQCPLYAPTPSVGITSLINNNAHPGPYNQSDNSIVKQISQTHSNMQILDEATAARNSLLVAPQCQGYNGEAMFADMLDLQLFEDLRFGEDFPLLDSNIPDNGAM